MYTFVKIFFSLPIRIKVILTFLLLFVLGLAAAFLHVKQAEKRIVDQVVSEQVLLTRQLLQVFERQITTRLQNLEQTTFLLSDLSIVQSLFNNDQTEGLVLDSFENVLLKNPATISLKLADLTGETRLEVTPEKSQVYQTSNQESRVSQYDYFPFVKQISMNEVGIFIGDPDEYQDPHLDIVAPVYDGFLPMGYVIQTVSVNGFINDVLRLIGKDGAFLLMMSQRANYLFGEDARLQAGKQSPAFEPAPSSPFKFSQAFPNTWQGIQLLVKGKPDPVWSERGLYFTVHPLEIEFDNVGLYQSWLLAYFSEEKVLVLAAPQLEGLHTRFIIISIVIVIIACFLSWWMYRHSMMEELSFMAQAAMQSMSPIILLDLNQNIIKVNNECLKVMGMSIRDLCGQRFSSFLNEEDRIAFERMWQQLSCDSSWKGELRFVDAQGRDVEGLFQLFPLESSKSKNQGYVVSWMDIREQKALERRLRSLTITDALTGCKNRRYYDHQVTGLFSNLIRHPDQTFCMALADIDHFKHVNDEFGHDVGDEVLQAFAALLEQETRTLDVVCRVGGEEFAILLPNTQLKDALMVVERVRKMVAAFPLAGHDITCSFGVAESNPATDEDDLYKSADNALYLAKENGRNQVISSSKVVQGTFEPPSSQSAR